MRKKEYEVVIVGVGHNGLACAALLTKYGVPTLVVERNDWVGGGVLTREVTLPGFKHDVYGSSHVWIHINPTFKNELQPELEKHGLKYVWAEDHITGHPNLEGPGIIVYKDVDKTCDSIAEYSRNDARRYREIYEEFEEVRAGVVRAMFSPPSPPSFMFQALESNSEGLRRLRDYQLSSRAFTMKNFENPHVQAFILGWAMAPQTLPDQEATAQGFYVMIPSIHYFGESIPEGGSGMLCESMKSYIDANGGKVMTGATVDKFIIENNECKGVRLADGTDIMASRAVVTGLDPQQTFLRCMEDHEVDPRIRDIVSSFSFGNVTIARAHYALHESPIFNNGPDMTATPFQRTFGSIDDIDKQYNEIAAGLAPSDPFLWSACWTKKDPSRAPDGKHTMILDTFVPVDLASGEDWEEIGPKYVKDILLRNLRRHTSNMTDDNIMAEFIDTGPNLARDNWSYVNGTTTGGERILSQLGAFRPIPGFAEYRSPVVNLYMTGPSCHPGGGISAMGTNTANAMLEDFGLKEPQDAF